MPYLHFQSQKNTYCKKFLAIQWIAILFFLRINFCFGQTDLIIKTGPYIHLPDHPKYTSTPIYTNPNQIFLNTDLTLRHWLTRSFYIGTGFNVSVLNSCNECVSYPDNRASIFIYFTAKNNCRIKMTGSLRKLGIPVELGMSFSKPSSKNKLYCNLNYLVSSWYNKTNNYTGDIILGEKTEFNGFLFLPLEIRASLGYIYQISKSNSFLAEGTFGIHNSFITSKSIGISLGFSQRL